MPNPMPYIINLIVVLPIKPLIIVVCVHLSLKLVFVSFKISIEGPRANVFSVAGLVFILGFIVGPEGGLWAIWVLFVEVLETLSAV